MRLERLFASKGYHLRALPTKAMAGLVPWSAPPAAEDMLAASRARRSKMELRPDVTSALLAALDAEDKEASCDPATLEAARAARERREIRNVVISKARDEVVERNLRAHRRHNQLARLAPADNAVRSRAAMRVELRRKLTPAALRGEYERRVAEAKRVGTAPAKSSGAVDPMDEHLAELGQVRMSRTAAWEERFAELSLRSKGESEFPAGPGEYEEAAGGEGGADQAADASVELDSSVRPHPPSKAGKSRPKTQNHSRRRRPKQEYPPLDFSEAAEEWLAQSSATDSSVEVDEHGRRLTDGDALLAFMEKVAPYAAAPSRSPPLLSHLLRPPRCPLLPLMVTPPIVAAVVAAAAAASLVAHLLTASSSERFCSPRLQRSTAEVEATEAAVADTKTAKAAEEAAAGDSGSRSNSRGDGQGGASEQKRVVASDKPRIRTHA